MALNVERVREAIEYLKRPEVVLGAGYFTDVQTYTKPCCTLGHMAEFAGAPVAGIDNIEDLHETLGDLYGLDSATLWVIVGVNDTTPAGERKATVVAHLERLIEAEGVQTVG